MCDGFVVEMVPDMNVVGGGIVVCLVGGGRVMWMVGGGLVNRGGFCV